ncbi:S-layer homology domain-containing protein [uncultured Flavonifractor sp.]|uniref:S-layer homology domain-containing protein n=1 Tax=uncultured Flavonifractor sp. TaxID=1193534 RepID=UPI0026169F9B|nr:S-layer homology domain-containing protein [uncultured Flavonifractor sp.]
MQAKKPLALLLSLSMGLSMGTPALAAARQDQLPDVAQSWAADSIHRWLEAGLVEGNDQGLFRPAANLTRGELATIFVRLLGLTEQAENRYADLKGDEWYADAILKCTAAGILEGDGENCNATQTITRQETMVMFARAMGVRADSDPDLSRFTDGAQAADWSAGYLSVLTQMGILSGVEDGSRLAPLGSIDRASTMALLDKAIESYITGSDQVKLADGNRFVVVNAGASRSGSQVEVSGETAGLVVAPGSTGTKLTAQDLSVGTVQVDAPVDLTLAGETRAEYLALNAAARLALEEQAKVNALTVNAAAQVDNQGTIDAAQVNVGGVVLEGNLPGSLEVADGVTGPTDSEGNPVGGEEEKSGPAITQVAEEDGKVTIHFDQALYTMEDGQLTKLSSGALQSDSYTISGDVKITDLQVDNEEAFVWTVTFTDAKLGDGVRSNKAIYDAEGNCAGYLTARRQVALKDDEGRTPHYVWAVSFEEEAEADIAAPVLDKEGVKLEGNDHTLTLTVPVSDNGPLAFLEIDHSLEDSFPEFTVEAKSYTYLDEDSGLGYTSVFTDTLGEQKWEITLNPTASALLRQAADGSPVTFYFAGKDQAGNQFGSMYFVEESMTVADVAVPLDETAPTVAGFEIDGKPVSDGATVNFDEGAEFTTLTVIMSEAVEAGDEPLKITIDGHKFGTFVIDEKDAAKLHITVTNHNGNKYVEGTYQFDLAAGTLKDAAGNENEELSYTIHFTKNPAV